jgi:hypothetical protein
MLNIDLESKNSAGSGSCHSKLHDPLGSHFDLTVHTLGCHHGGSAVDRPPIRYWDDNAGVGYTLEQVISLARTLGKRYSDSHPRRCLKCDVESNLPDWD